MSVELQLVCGVILGSLFLVFLFLVYVPFAREVSHDVVNHMHEE